MELPVGQYVLRLASRRASKGRSGSRMPARDQIRYTIVNRMIHTRSTKCQYRPVNSIGL